MVVRQFLSLTLPSFTHCSGGDCLVFGNPQGCVDRTSVLIRVSGGHGGLGSTLSPNQLLTQQLLLPWKL